MRREGRLHSYEFNRELMYHVKTSNNKSLKKIKGQGKRNELDVTSNHLMHDWGLDKHHMKAVGGEIARDIAPRQAPSIRRMRRKGRLHGYEFNRELMYRVQTSNKPSNCSKETGKCGRARCGSCHWHPVNKSLNKIKGQRKRNVLDVTSNHLMHDWGLDKHHMKAVGGRRALLKGGDWLGDHDIDTDAQDEMQEYFDRWMQGYYIHDADEKYKEVGGEEDEEKTPEIAGEEEIEREIVDEKGETTDSSGEFEEGDEDEERSMSDWLEVACDEERCLSEEEEEEEEDWYLC